MAAPARTASAPPALLHELFTDHAVLQRDQPIAVFGQAAPRETVLVTLDTVHAETQADASGHWRILLPPQPAGGPHTLTAATRAGDMETRADILVGDIFLCSGQSNMEFAVAAALNAEREIKSAADDHIRLLTVPHATSSTPLEHFHDAVRWSAASADSAREFSAACLFFGQQLERTEHVPLGLIQSTWSGSRIEPWISAQGLARLPGYAERLGLLSDYAHDPARGMQAMGEYWQRWYQTRAGSPAAPWREAGGEGWRALPLPMRDWKTWGVPELAQHDGMVWFRRKFSLDAHQAASTARLSIGAIDEVDQTWVNGRLVGSTFGYGTERTYDIPTGTLHAGENLLVLNVLSTWDAGGMYGPPEHSALEPAQQLPVPLAGDWQYHTVAEQYGLPAARTLGVGVRSYSHLQCHDRAAPAAAAARRALVPGRVEHLGGSELPRVADHAVRRLAKSVQGRPALPRRAASQFRRTAVRARGIHLGKPARCSAPRRAGRPPRRARRDHRRRRAAGTASAQQAGRRCCGLPGLHGSFIYGATDSASGPVVARSDAAGAARSAWSSTMSVAGLRTLSAAHATGFEICGDGPGSCRYADTRIESRRVILRGWPGSGQPRAVLLGRRAALQSL